MGTSDVISPSNVINRLPLLFLMYPLITGLNLQRALLPHVPASTPGPGPYFDEFHSGNVTALLGNSAVLNCRVMQLKNATVSWVRATEVPTLLSVNTYLYTMNTRMQVSHSPRTWDWAMTIERVSHNDSGVYGCQIGTTPPITRHVHLTVVEPDTEVLGGPEIYIDERSTINLTCIVEHSPQPPNFILWQHDQNMINYDSERGGVSVVTTKGPVTVSQLLIRRARPPDSGVYTCRPASSRPASVRVHVLQGGQRPEAMLPSGTCRTSGWLPVPPLLQLLPLYLSKYALISVR